MHAERGKKTPARLAEGTYQDAGGGGDGDEGARRRAQDHVDLPVAPVVGDLRMKHMTKKGE